MAGRSRAKGAGRTGRTVRTPPWPASRRPSRRPAPAPAGPAGWSRTARSSVCRRNASARCADRDGRRHSRPVLDQCLHPCLLEARRGPAGIGSGRAIRAGRIVLGSTGRVCPVLTVARPPRLEISTMGIASQPTRSRPPHPAPAPPAFATVQEGARFRTLPAPLREALLEMPPRARSPRPLFSRGDPFDGLYCVLSGTVQVDAVSAAGKAALLGLLEAGTGSARSACSTACSAPRCARRQRRQRVAGAARAAAAAAGHPSGGRNSAGCWRPRHARPSVSSRRRSCWRRCAHRAPAGRAGPGQWRRHRRKPGGAGPAHPAHPAGTTRADARPVAPDRQPALRDTEARGLLRLHYAGIELLDPDALAALG